MDTIIHFDIELLYGMILQWINTGILFFILWKLLYAPVSKFLNERSNKIETQLTNAEEAEKTAILLKEDYEKKLSQISIERNEILDKARKQAIETSDSIISEAKAEQELLRKRTNDEIAMEIAKTRDDMKKEMIEIGSLIASKYVSKEISVENQNALIDDAIASLETAN